MNCHKCGLPLYTGNIRVVRKPGKRPRREHRKCPPRDDFVETTRLGDPKPTFVHAPKPREDTADATRLQRPQDTTGGPLTATVVLDYPEPPRYRYFMTRDQAKRVKASVERNASFGFGIAFEVIPVPDYQVEADPDTYGDLVEVTVEWKNGK